jgi:hypothetical protein
MSLDDTALIIRQKKNVTKELDNFMGNHSGPNSYTLMGNHGGPKPLWETTAALNPKPLWKPQQS